MMEMKIQDVIAGAPSLDLRGAPQVGQTAVLTRQLQMGRVSRAFFRKVHLQMLRDFP